MVQTRVDQKRGCGWRKPGGLYLVAPGLNAPCCKLPIPLTICPCCGEGIRLSRAWTWVNLNVIAGLHECTESGAYPCPLRSIGNSQAAPQFDKVGLIRVGEQYYPEVNDFLEEANRLGVSRRIHAVPKGFVVGETWVALAHKKAIRDQRADEGVPLDASAIYTPGIFTVFKPTAIEYITTGEESEEVLQHLWTRGITPVKVVKPTPRPYPF